MKKKFELVRFFAHRPNLYIYIYTDKKSSVVDVVIVIFTTINKSNRRLASEYR